ncbi:hypothetical protein MKW98_012282, partial [Papaver atlanticum]
ITMSLMTVVLVLSTALLHFGKEDYRVCIAHQIIQKGKKLIVAVDDDGCFTEKVSHFCGRYVKDADKEIINDVKASMKIINSMNF